MRLVLIEKHAHRIGNIRHVRYCLKAIATYFSCLLSSKIVLNCTGKVFPLCNGFRIITFDAKRRPHRIESSLCGYTTLLMSNSCYFKALPHTAMKWIIFLRFGASRSIADHRRSSQVSALKSQQCGQSATHDGMFSYSPGMFIAAMVIRNIQLIILYHIIYHRKLHEIIITMLKPV